MSDMNDWNTKIIEEFRANAGKVGGQFEGAPMLILHTTGARSGAERLNPLMYLELDGHLYIFASKGGAPADPDWYRNLLANPDVSVEIGTDTRSYKAAVVEGAERDRIYDVQGTRFPGFAEYARNTTRVIPVVELLPNA